MKKIQKGDYGYLHYHKKMEILKTACLFALVLAIFVTGYVTTKTRLNWFTLVAVLGCLPACREAVSMFMILPRKSTDPEIYHQVKAVSKKSSVAYELVMTTYDKTMPVDCIAVMDHTLIGYAGDEKSDANLLEKHLRDVCQGNQFKVNVKIYKSLDSFLRRLKELEEKGEPGELQEQVVGTMLAISL